METALSESIENLAGIFMFMGALMFIALLARTFSLADRNAAQMVKEKQSIVQTQDNIRNKTVPSAAWEKKHPNIEHTLTGDEVFASVLFSDMPDNRTSYRLVTAAGTSYIYRIDPATGSNIGFCDLPAAKEGDETQIRLLKSRCVAGTYRVTEVYAHDTYGDYLSEITYTQS